MTIAEDEWGFSNPGPSTILLWLEPWADEFEIPARSTVVFRPSNGSGPCALGQLELCEDHLVVWTTAQTVEVLIDGVLQHSGSAVIPIPDGLTKEMLGIVFANQPTTRLGGARSPLVGHMSLWRRAARYLGL